MKIEESIENGTVTLKVEGNITSYQGAEFLNAVIDASTRGDHVILDLTEVQSMSSAGLRGLIMGYKNLSSRGGTLELRGVSQTVRETIKITGLDKMLTSE